MSEQQQDEQILVEITDEEGNVVANCEVYDIVEFEDKEYALLLPVDSEDEEEAELIVMEYYEEGEEGFFKNIDDDNEYDRVCEYIESLEYEDEDEE